MSLLAQAAAELDVRVTQITDHDAAIFDIHSSLEAAAAVICDLTDASPSIMFELGVAYSFGHPVLLIASHPEHIPHNLRHLIVVVDDLSQGTDRLLDAMRKFLTRALLDPTSLRDEVRAREASARVFISYSHRDREYLDRLLVHLKPLERSGIIDLFVDTKIKPGDRWQNLVEAALRNARAAVLLVSADFMASDFIVRNELPPLLAEAERGGTRVVPVVLKPCRFLRDPNLRGFQSINDPRAPLVQLPEHMQEQIYDQVASLLEDLLPRRS